MAPDVQGSIAPGVSELIIIAKALRVELADFEKKVINLKTIIPPVSEVIKGEAIANIMLSFRHLEDARMRLGKVIQAVDGGVSVYDGK